MSVTVFWRGGGAGGVGPSSLSAAAPVGAASLLGGASGAPRPLGAGGAGSSAGVLIVGAASLEGASTAGVEVFAFSSTAASLLWQQPMVFRSAIEVSDTARGRRDGLIASVNVISPLPSIYARRYEL